jgi:radical SAM superfamily enzyme YgiQ (UPF0313 family)
VEALETGRDYHAIPSLIFHEGNAVQVNDATKTSPELPLELSDRPTQIASPYLRTGGMLNLQTQRGCAHRCCYCTYPLIEGTRHRSRSPELVVADFEQVQTLGARYAAEAQSENTVGLLPPASGVDPQDGAAYGAGGAGAYRVRLGQLL